MASAYTPTNSNNPFGPNIILDPNQTITVGATSFGKLYTGGFTNSGTTLAAYLSTIGPNKSRYNSDEATPNYTTALGTGLTAIYRQKPSLTLTAPDVNITYGNTPVLSANTISGLLNGDTETYSVSNYGTSSYSANTSTAGKQRVGSYEITTNISSALSGIGVRFQR